MTNRPILLPGDLVQIEASDGWVWWVRSHRRDRLVTPDNEEVILVVSRFKQKHKGSKAECFVLLSVRTKELYDFFVDESMTKEASDMMWSSIDLHLVRLS